MGNAEACTQQYSGSKPSKNNLVLVINAGYQIVGCSERSAPPILELRETQPSFLADSCQIIKIKPRLTTKRTSTRQIKQNWVEDFELITGNMNNVCAVGSREGAIYVLSPQHISLLEEGRCIPVRSSFMPMKHFLPMKDGNFISTTYAEDQWWITLHRASGS